MRKFQARWWVADPLARYNAACEACRADSGISLRYVRTASPADGLYAECRVIREEPPRDPPIFSVADSR